MRRRFLLFLTLLLPACAHLGLASSTKRSQRELWDAAHHALAAQDFARADEHFAHIIREYPESTAGVESLFYRGSIRLDPRNPNWAPEPAEEYLRRYLAMDSIADDGVHRRPEAETFFQLARQLNLPAEQRVPQLQPETKVVRVPHRIVRYRESQELESEVERLRNAVAERDARIEAQQKELERIRKTLTGSRQ